MNLKKNIPGAHLLQNHFRHCVGVGGYGCDYSGGCGGRVRRCGGCGGMDYGKVIGGVTGGVAASQVVPPVVVVV